MTNEELINTVKDAMRNDTVLNKGMVELLCNALVAVTEQRDALVAENANILALMHEQSECFNAAIAEGFHDAVMQSGIDNLIDVYRRRLQPAIQCIPPTPATSSAIAALRAEVGAAAIEEFVRMADYSESIIDGEIIVTPNSVFAAGHEYARQLRESKGAQS